MKNNYEHISAAWGKLIESNLWKHFIEAYLFYCMLSHINGWKEFIEKYLFFYSLPPSDGTTGQKWVRRLEKNGYALDDTSKELLILPKFKPTNGVKYKVAILKGEFFGTRIRTSKNIRKFVSYFNWPNTNPEIACLLREALSNANIHSMGLSRIIIMSNPFHNRDLLGIGSIDNKPGMEGYLEGNISLTQNDELGDLKWLADTGFAFVKSKSRIRTRK